MYIEKHKSFNITNMLDEYLLILIQFYFNQVLCKVIIKTIELFATYFIWILFKKLQNVLIMDLSFLQKQLFRRFKKKSNFYLIINWISIIIYNCK